jgi:glycosyltransferase involved in cell wall biosynthesis
MTVPESLATFLRGQVGYVQARGIEVHAIASSGPQLDHFAEREGVPVYPVDMPRGIDPIRDIAAIARLYRTLRRIRPDIVQAGTPQGGLLGTIAATLARAPVRIYHIRGLPLMTATGPKRHVLRYTEKIACRLAHRVLCVSHSIREVAIAEGLCPPDKIVVLCGGSGNGVDAEGRYNPDRLPPEAGAQVRDRYGIPQDALVVGFVGRFHSIKGAGELLDAWTVLSADRPELHLLAVGPIEEHDPAPRAVLDALQSDPRIHMTGRADDMASIYAAMDVFAFPTYREGLPNVLLEASAMAVAAVATSVPGCTDVIQDGATGTLVPVRDATSLADGIRRYLDDPTLARAHGRAARERVTHGFRQETIWQALVDEYERLMTGDGIGPPIRAEDRNQDSLSATTRNAESAP